MSSYYNSSLNKIITWGGVVRELAIPPIIVLCIVISFFLVSADFTTLKFVIPTFLFVLIYFIIVKILTREDPNNLKYWFYTFKVNNKPIINKMTRTTPTPYIYPLKEMGIITKEGRLVLTYKVTFIDRNKLNAFQNEWRMKSIESDLNNSLNNYELHFNEFKTKTKIAVNKKEDFKNPLLQAIEDEIHISNEQKIQTSKHYVSVIIDNIADKTKKEIAEEVNNIDGVIQKMFEKANRLTINEHLNYINLCLTGENKKFKWLKNYVFIEDLLDIDISYKDGVKVEDNNVVLVSITALPENLGSQIFSYLSDQEEVQYRISSRYKPLSKQETQKILKRKVQIMETSEKSLSDNLKGNSTSEENINYEMMDAKTKTRDARVDFSINDRRYGYFTMTIVLSGKEVEKLKDIGSALIKTLPLGVHGKIETINAINSFLGTIPAGSSHNKRELLINTSNFTDIVNLYSLDLGDPVSPNEKLNGQRCVTVFKTEGSTPYYFNLHSQDVGHTCILGATGSGKSTLLNIIIAQYLRYENSKIIIFQKDRGMTPFIRGIGGIEIDPMKSDYKFSPLSNVDSESKIKKNNFASYVLDMAIHNNPQIKKNRKNTESILNALDILFEYDKQINKDNQEDYESYKEDDYESYKEDDYENLFETQKISFSMLVEQIQDNAISSALSIYLGTIFDGIKDDFILNINNNNVIGIEVSNILKADDNFKLPILEYIFSVSEKIMDGNPVLIVIDEAQFIALSDKLAKEFKNYLETIRKKNGAVVLATLSANKFYEISPDFFDTVDQSTKTKIYMIGSDKKTTHNFSILENAQEKMDLLVPKKNALIVKDNSVNIIDIELGSQLKRFGTASLKELKEIDKMSNKELFKKWNITA